MDQKEIVNMFSKAKVLIIGDIILDKYIFGNVDRISPEAPIPVLKVNSEKYVLGGAANVANNVVSLGGKAYLVGIIGNDEAGGIFLDELKKRHIDSSGIIMSARIPTTQKIRVLAKKNQLVRLDYEETQYNEENAILEMLDIYIPNADIVLVSDYAKGAITKKIMQKIIMLCKQQDKKIIVDTKPAHKEFFKDVFLIKLNQKETEGFSGVKLVNEEAINVAGARIIQELNCNVLITRGEKGMSLFLKESNEHILNIPTQAKEVYDVSGAGDTVMASLGLSICAGADLVESAEIANHAAGIAVGKLGTSIVNVEELMAKFDEQNKKIVSRENIVKIVQELKAKNKRIVFTNGCFDILHVGHIRLLQKAKSFGDILILGLNTDSSVKKLKGPTRPIVNENERAEILSSLDCVDYVVFFDENEPSKIISEIRPDIHVKGGDYNPNDYSNMPEARIVHEYGGEVKIVNLVEGKSTTEIINKLSQNT